MDENFYVIIWLKLRFLENLVIMIQFVERVLKINRDRSIGACIEDLEEKYNFQIQLKKLKRARRLTLRICHITGEVKITTPLNIKMSSLKGFIDKNAPWILAQRKTIQSPIKIDAGTSIPMFGVEKQILVDHNCHDNYKISNQSLILPQTHLNVKKQIKSTLLQIAEDYFVETCNKYSQKLNTSFAQLSIRDPKSRWGSCSSQKRLMFSWRLIMAPNSVSSYVAAHEVAHLLHLNHSCDFWSIVELISPDYPAQRNWLRKNGRSLHKFIF